MAVGDPGYRLVVTTSGTGSRLGELTKKTNKALVDIAGRSAIAYVLDKYSRDIPVVVTVGYLEDQVREFFKHNYNDRQIELVKVDPYEGPGSSLGYSLLQAERNLQCPFVFHACDTIVLEDIPAPDENWAIGYKVPEESSLEVAQYRTHKVVDGKLVRVNDKGAMDFELIHIGITGIKNYRDFWRILRSLYEADSNDSGISDVHVISQMLAEGIPFKSIGFSTWLDTGNVAALEETRRFLAK